MESGGDLLIEQLRQAIRDCGMAEHELANAAGVPHDRIVQLRLGKDPGLKAASKIAAYLGLELRPRHALVPSS